MESLPNFPIYRHGPSATSGLIRRRNLGGLTLLSRFWRSWRRIHRLRSTPTSGESTVSSLRISKHKTEKTPLLANTLASAAALPACNVVSGIWMVTLALTYLLKNHKFSTSLRGAQGSKLLSMAARVSLWRTFPLRSGRRDHLSLSASSACWFPTNHSWYNLPSLGKPSPFMGPFLVNCC